MYIDAVHIESQYKEKKKNHIYGVDRAATKILLVVRINQLKQQAYSITSAQFCCACCCCSGARPPTAGPRASADKMSDRRGGRGHGGAGEAICPLDSRVCRI